jgi:hypothetical protein
MSGIKHEKGGFWGAGSHLCGQRVVYAQYNGNMVADFASTTSTPPPPPASGRYSSITVFEVCGRLNQPLRYHCFGSTFGFDLWPGPLSEVNKIIFTLNIPVCCTRPYYKVVISGHQHFTTFYETSHTWSLTWREKCRLRVYENRVLRKLFGPRRGEVTRE